MTDADQAQPEEPTWRAQLKAMPLEVILSYLLDDQGFAVTLRKPGTLVWSDVEDDAPLPFEVL
jgi:hypothetical protein